MSYRYIRFVQEGREKHDPVKETDVKYKGPN